MFGVLRLILESRNVHSCGDFTITGEGQQFLTFTRHLAMSGKGSAAPIITQDICSYGHLWGSMTLPHSVKRLAGELSYLFLRLRSVAAVIRKHIISKYHIENQLRKTRLFCECRKKLHCEETVSSQFLQIVWSTSE